MLIMELIVPFNSLDNLKAALICFGHNSLHYYIPECFEKKKRKNQVLIWLLQILDMYCWNKSLCMRNATADAFLPTLASFLSYCFHKPNAGIFNLFQS